MARSLLKISKSIRCRRFSQLVESSSGFSVEYLTGVDKGIVVIGFNNSRSRNALGKEFTKTLYGTLDEISNDSAARVVLFRSLIPKVFCAGADLKERLTMSQSETNSYVTFLRNLMLKIQNVPVPTIAAIDGAALGGGLELALSCDIRVASESARIGLVETKLAIMPGAGGTQRLPRLIGPALAKELIFTARILNGNEARQYGIVNHCVPDNKDGSSAFIKTMDIAREIIPNGPAAVKLAKFAINKGQEVDIHQGCSIEELCYAQIVPTKDRIEGLQAFLEKRKPIYSGE